MGVFLTCFALVLPAFAGLPQVPALEGSSIRIDFSPSATASWRTSLPHAFQAVVIPRKSWVEWDNITRSNAWETAAVLGPLVREQPETDLRAFYAEDALYLRVRNFFDAKLAPAAGMRERDLLVDGEDRVEIRIQVPTKLSGQKRYRPEEVDQPPVYHFVVNQAGALFDAKDGDAGYDAAWLSRVETGENEWTLWVKLPFHAMELTGPVAELAVNIGRDGQSASRLSWGPEWARTDQRLLVLEGIAAGAVAGATHRPDGIGSGSMVSLCWISGVARPQDRWIEGRLTFNNDLPEDAKLVVSLWAPGAEDPVESVRVRPEGDCARLLVDLRRWGLESARITAALWSENRIIGAAEDFLYAKPLPEAPPDGFAIPLLVDLPDRMSRHGLWPLNVGIPFPAGLAWNVDGWRIEDAEGNAYPTQKEITGLWADEGAIQWLRVDTLADPAAKLSLVYRPGEQAPEPESPVRVERNGDRIILANAEVEYRLAAGHSPIMEVYHRGRLQAAAETARGLYLVDQRGQLATASAEGAGMRIEAAGPVAACVRIEGDYRTTKGEVLGRHITRIELSAGMPFARVTHTLVLTRDSNEVWFREVGWEFDGPQGRNPEVFFATSREDPSSFHRIKLGKQASILQESYYRFGTGEKRFRIRQGGREVKSGLEMGDWMLAKNSAGGLLISCRESARQHPKEFQTDGRRMAIKLFSPEAGEELDFRAKTLAGKWNLLNWYSNDRWDSLPDDQKAAIKESVANVEQIPSNALGWAKTHEILLCPASANMEPDEAAVVSLRHSRPGFVLADPEWIYRSRAMGPLHPRDPARFPEAERLIDGAFAFFASRVPEFGEWGFVDYYAGPHLNQHGKYPEPRRWTMAYTLRADSWLVFARSGLRAAFDFASATNRAYGDNCLASWGDQSKVKGLFTDSSGPDRRDGAPNLPFYWGDSTLTYQASSTNLNQFIWDYHLTGYRRAGDQVRDFAAGLKQAVTPELLNHDWRIIMTFRTLLQCYGFTWDPALKDLANAAADIFEDPDSAVYLSKNRPYRASTYKTRVDIRALIEAWDLLGDPRYQRMALRLGEFVWNSYAGLEPISYTNPQGILGQFLYEQTRRKDIAQSLLIFMRWASSQYDPAIFEHGIALGAHEAAPIFEGIPAMQDVIVRTGADRQPLASWIGVIDFEHPVEFAFRKKDQDAAQLALATPYGFEAGVGGPTMEAINPSSKFGVELISGFQQRAADSTNLFTRWTVPLDTPAGAFKVTPSAYGSHLAVLDSNRPLVLFAPSFWVPWPPQNPPVRWYFNVPEDAEAPAIFFEGAARILTPDGRIWRESGPEGGWFDLPPSPSGLWSFTPLETRLVRVRNLPPFFAADYPERWFDPGLEWSREDRPATDIFKAPEKSGFVAGISDRTSDRALFVGSEGTFALDGATATGEEKTGNILPFQEGTIEFWMRPAWGTFDAPRGKKLTRNLLQMVTDLNNWELSYLMDYSGPFDRPGLQTYTLDAVAMAEDGERRRRFRNSRRQTFFQPGEWVHIAMVWGVRTHPTPEGPRELLSLVTYVNGKAGNRDHSGTRVVGMRPSEEPKRLIFPRLNAAIDQLHISDVMRYETDFAPPARNTPVVPDQHTRAYFEFDGTLEGQTGNGVAVIGTLQP